MSAWDRILIEEEEQGGPTDNEIMMMQLEYDAKCSIAKALCRMNGQSPSEWVMLDKKVGSSSLLGRPLAFATWLSNLTEEEYPRIVMRWQTYASQVAAFQEAFDAQEKWERQAETWSY